MTAPPDWICGVRDILQASDDRLRPGDLWFSKASLGSFADLIISMTQYRPSDRPSASEVLQHPWFQRSPDLDYEPGEITWETAYEAKKWPDCWKLLQHLCCNHPGGSKCGKSRCAFEGK